MKKLLLALLGFGVLGFASLAQAQFTNNLWKLSGGSLLPVSNSYSVTIPQLGPGTFCVHSVNGLLSVTNSDCGSGSGGGSSTVVTSASSPYLTFSALVNGNTTGTLASVFSLNTATGTLTLATSGPVSLTQNGTLLTLGFINPGYVLGQGSGVANDCVKWSNSSTIADQGAPCGAGGSGFTNANASSGIAVSTTTSLISIQNIGVVSLSNNSASGGIDFSQATGTGITGLLHSLNISQFTNNSGYVTSTASSSFARAVTKVVCASNAIDTTNCDYKATGVDDGLIINTALQTVASSTAGAGTVYLSAGTYYASTTVAWTQSGVRLQGEGIAATIIDSSSTSYGVHVGNRESGGPMLNYAGASDFTVNMSSNTSTAAVFVDGCGRQGVYQNIIAQGYANRSGATTFGFDNEDIDRCQFNNIYASGGSNAQFASLIGKENTFGNGQYSNIFTVLSYASSTGILWGYDAANQSSPSGYGRVVLNGWHTYSPTNTTSSIGMRFDVGGQSMLIEGGLGENNNVQVQENATTTTPVVNVTWLDNQFVNSGNVSTDIFQFKTYNHNNTYIDNTFQQATNGFHTLSGFPNLDFEGKNSNQGNITNLFSGSFSSKTGSDANFCGANNCVQGLNAAPYANTFSTVSTFINGGLALQQNASGTLEVDNGNTGQLQSLSALNLFASSNINSSGTLNVIGTSTLIGLSSIGCSGTPTQALTICGTPNNGILGIHNANAGGETSMEFDDTSHHWIFGENIGGNNLGQYSVFNGTTGANNFQIDTAGNIKQSSTTVTGNTTTTNLTVTSVINGLGLFDAAGHLSAFAGSSCASGVMTGHSASGTALCAATSTILTGYSTSTGANPTANIGTATVNGSANTFMRSDAAPTINQAATFSFSALGNTTSTGNIQATSYTGTTSTMTTVSSTQICLGGTCNTTWPAGGSGAVTTSTNVTANYFPFWNSTNGSGLNGTSSLYRPSTNDVTVASTSDNGLLSVVNASNTVALKIASTTGATSSAVSFNVLGNVSSSPAAPISIFQILSSGHMNSTGTTPVASTCGSSPNVTGTDEWGTVGVGGGVVTACTLTWQIPYETNNYQCNVSDNSATISAGVTSQTSSTITIGTSATLGGGKIFYFCGMNQ